MTSPRPWARAGRTSPIRCACPICRLPVQKAGKAGARATKSGDTQALEKRIEEALGLKADLKLRGVVGEQSRLTLEIRDYDQLDTVVERLMRR